jgi:hypothetical protein
MTYMQKLVTVEGEITYKAGPPTPIPFPFLHFKLLYTF